MTTLITGAGLVGSLAAVRLIAEHGERPVLYDVAFSMANLADRVPLDQVDLVAGDVNDVPDLVQALQKHGVDRIIHTAGLLTSTVRGRPYAGVRINLNGTLSTLEAARLAGVRRVVFCSSNTVYLGLRERPPDGKAHEDFSLRTVSEAPPSVYASMKLAAEWLGHCYTNEYGLDVVSVRFGGVFGPWRGAPSGGPSRLVQQLLEGAWRGQPARVGAGDLERPGMDYVYAADAAQGTVRAAYAQTPSSRVYNISMGEVYTVTELSSLIERVTGRPVSIERLPGQSLSGYANPMWPADLSRAQQELGFEVEFPMERAIEDYADWLKKEDIQA